MHENWQTQLEVIEKLLTEHKWAELRKHDRQTAQIVAEIKDRNRRDEIKMLRELKKFPNTIILAEHTPQTFKALEGETIWTDRLNNKNSKRWIISQGPDIAAIYAKNYHLKSIQHSLTHDEFGEETINAMLEPEIWNRLKQQPAIAREWIHKVLNQKPNISLKRIVNELKDWPGWSPSNQKHPLIETPTDIANPRAAAIIILLIGIKKAKENKIGIIDSLPDSAIYLDKKYRGGDLSPNETGKLREWLPKNFLRNWEITDKTEQPKGWPENGHFVCIIGELLQCEGNEIRNHERLIATRVGKNLALITNSPYGQYNNQVDQLLQKRGMETCDLRKVATEMESGNYKSSEVICALATQNRFWQGDPESNLDAFLKWVKHESNQEQKDQNLPAVLHRIKLLEIETLHRQTSAKDTRILRTICEIGNQIPDFKPEAATVAILL